MPAKKTSKTQKNYAPSVVGKPSNATADKEKTQATTAPKTSAKTTPKATPKVAQKPTPKAPVKPDAKLNDPKLYFNRELSWLAFNKRVLDESQNAKIPLLERLKFIAIYSTNLDEFYMIRVAGLARLYAQGITQSGPDAMSPKEQLANIRAHLHSEQKELEQNFTAIKTALSKEGLKIRQIDELSAAQKARLHEHFTANLYPIIVPIIVDSTHPFPHLNNLSFGIAIKLVDEQGGEDKFGMVRISRNLPRFVGIDNMFVAIEDVVGAFAGDLFMGHRAACYVPFRVTRNADMEIEEEEADDFLQLMSDSLKTRRKGEIVRLEIGKFCEINCDRGGCIDSNATQNSATKNKTFTDSCNSQKISSPEALSSTSNAKSAPAKNQSQNPCDSQKICDADALKGFITTYIKTDAGDIYNYNIPLNLSGLWQLVGAKEFAHLTTPPYAPKMLPPLNSLANANTAGANILDILDTQDVLCFQPYESFEPVVNFIQSAAKDPDVLSIRMTLYRVGKNSPIVKALIEAAENGKQVTALVELKARFDEENNLYWAKSLESAGAHVIYGIPGLKVHAKIALVIKRAGGGLKEYVHLSTGNYNPSTAKLYTDISLLSSRKDFANDGVHLFHSLSTGNAHKIRLDALNIAPTQIKETLLRLIEAESAYGADGHIIMKANALIDADIIKALYRASMAGTRVDLIIRGICALRPGVAGVSENIRVRSIIGKYLEHARIYYFKHERIYFSSADLMPRNLVRRVEILTPAVSPSISKKLLDILHAQLNDNQNAHELSTDGVYTKISPAASAKPLNSHSAYENYVNKQHAAAMKAGDAKAREKANKLAQKMLGES